MLGNFYELNKNDKVADFSYPRFSILQLFVLFFFDFFFLALSFLSSLALNFFCPALASVSKHELLIDLLRLGKILKTQHSS